MYVNTGANESAAGRRVSVGEMLELFDGEFGLTDDAAQRTHGDLRVAWDDHDDVSPSGSADELHVAASAADFREPGREQLAPNVAVRRRPKRQRFRRGPF